MIEVYTFELPHRRGILLRTDETDNWSEISPLPGFSKESTGQALEALFDHDFDRYPSVAFGVEMLYVDLEPNPVPYTYLNDTSGSIVKLKMGHLSLKEALKVLPPLLDQGIKLRLDFNRKWSLADCLKLSESFPAGSFEYLEEPTRNLETFAKLTHHPIALDESLRLLPPSTFINLPTVSTFVIKPTLQGSVGDCLEIAQMATRAGKNIVMSSSHESGVGLINIIKFAHLLPKIHPLGIDTYKTPDVLKKPLRFEDGICYPSPLELNTKSLERIGVVSFEPIFQ
ncbi:MAG: hypothetical protein H7A40_06935 [Chlamydiales bacterium]|nr:hypothetical protein [Chlamydiales bacterium]